MGCSIFSGIGFDKQRPLKNCWDSPNLWINLCHQNIKEINKLTLINNSKGGASNSEIFQWAVDTISSNLDLKILVCGWTSMPRHNFQVGFELFDTSESLRYDGIDIDITHRLNDKVVTSEYIQDLVRRFSALHHLQYEIVKVIEYINILKRLAPQIKIINVNVGCPWDQGFFDFIDLSKEKPNSLTDFTKDRILNVKNRDDSEIMALYEKQHKQYEQAGGIQKHTWANLYHAFGYNIIDKNYDNQHPGIKSNQLYYEVFKQYFTANIAV